ncbi:hypothetical protein [Paenibacillus luteus]|uniref:hypothetical protein n=1 Tax=Paenibacillus luteus TaxID=2545753 RepID=UPI001141BA78|nr:hypothetical protein [Paenibacillus luteus]
MSHVQAVIIDPYYEIPLWLPEAERKETIYLSKNSSVEDVVLFLTLLCGYNHLDINVEPHEVVQQLIVQEKVAMSGGIAFEGNNKRILPSCCCGLEQWREVSDAVSNKKGVWLGHDPLPTTEYLNGSVRIWSDDYFGIYKQKQPTEHEKQAMYFIEFEHDVLINKLRGIETDLIEFFKYPLTQALAMIDNSLLDILFIKYCEWFQLKAS